MFAAALKIRTANCTAIRTNCGFIFVRDDDARKVGVGHQKNGNSNPHQEYINHPLCENPICKPDLPAAGKIELGT